MRKILRAAAALTATMVLAATMSSCAAAEKTVDYTETEVAITTGETLVVDFGNVNSSVGDEWVVVQEPDAKVLGPAKSRSEYQGEKGTTGSASHLSYRFAAVGSGTTEIAFEYRFRGEVPEDPDDQKTAEITVTVK